MKDPVDVAVAGAGPAGIAAAVQAVRLGLSVALLDETGKPGGLVVNACMVENYPGLEPLPGPVLAARIGASLDRFGIDIIRERVNSVSRNGGLVFSEGNRLSVRSRTLVVATGTAPLSPGIEGEAMTDRVYFSVRDIPLPFPGELAILGGGEAAFDYALTSAGLGADTLIVIRGCEPRASGRLREAVRKNGKIRILYDTTVGSIAGAGRRLELCTCSGSTVGKITTDALLIAAGRSRTHPVMEDGLLVDCGRELLGADGVFTAGDVRAGRLGQACTAAGQGLMAAGMAFDYLRERALGIEAD